ncbi:MAG: MlaD family protein [Planctomycetaceae bacterium]
MNARKNLVLGGFMLGALALLTFATFQLAGLSLQPRAKWRVYFGSESWIREGYDVYAAGTKVGIVSAVRRVPDAAMREGRYVVAELSLDPDLTLWEGARVTLASTGFLGSRAVVVHRGQPRGKPLPAGADLEGVVESDAVGTVERVLDDTGRRLTAALDEIVDLVARVNRGEGSVGKLVANDELYVSVLASAREIEAASRRLNDRDGTVGRLLADGTIAADMAEAAARLKSTSTELDRLMNEEKLGDELLAAVREMRRVAEGATRGEGIVARLLNDRGLADRLGGILEDTGAILADLREGKGSVGMLLRDPAVYNDLASLSSNLNAIATQLRQGKGSVGRLLMDDRVVRDLEAMLQAFRETGEAARENAPLSSLTSFTSLFFSVLN